MKKYVFHLKGIENLFRVEGVVTDMLNYNCVTTTSYHRIRIYYVSENLDYEMELGYINKEWTESLNLKEFLINFMPNIKWKTTDYSVEDYGKEFKAMKGRAIYIILPEINMTEI
jgi:hypothetical protein